MRVDVSGPLSGTTFSVAQPQPSARPKGQTWPASGGHILFLNPASALMLMWVLFASFSFFMMVGSPTSSVFLLLLVRLTAGSRLSVTQWNRSATLLLGRHTRHYSRSLSMTACASREYCWITYIMQGCV
jgi:hypothetical protein